MMHTICVHFLNLNLNIMFSEIWNGYAVVCTDSSSPESSELSWSTSLTLTSSSSSRRVAEWQVRLMIGRGYVFFKFRNIETYILFSSKTWSVLFLLFPLSRVLPKFEELSRETRSFTIPFVSRRINLMIHLLLPSHSLQSKHIIKPCACACLQVRIWTREEFFVGESNTSRLQRWKRLRRIDKFGVLCLCLSSIPCLS